MTPKTVKHPRLAAKWCVFPSWVILGGSLPIAPIFERLHAPVIIVPIANHDNNQHGHNENIRLENLWDGIETMAALLAME